MVEKRVTSTHEILGEFLEVVADTAPKLLLGLYLFRGKTR